jgi:hypothetical protein
VKLAAVAALLVLAGCGGSDTPSHPPGVLEFSAEFAKPLPQGFTTGAPVRIAGVNVGTVSAIDKRTVTLQVRAIPQRPELHADAQIILRPRIFKEGAWFADLYPGTAAAAPLDDGARLPSTQTRAYSGPPLPFR